MKRSRTNEEMQALIDDLAPQEHGTINFQSAIA